MGIPENDVPVLRKQYFKMYGTTLRGLQARHHVVCIAYVPDTETKIKVAPDGVSIDRTGVNWMMSPYDEFAVEEGLRAKEKFGGEVVVIGLGGDTHKETLRKALAMGADKALLLKDDAPRDSFGVAFGLAEELKALAPDLVLFGKQSIDYDGSQVGTAVAELLGFPSVAVVVKAEIAADGSVVCEREIEGGHETVTTKLPLVLMAQKGLNEPRYQKLFRELKAAGLRKVEFGVESMAPSQLKRLGKSTRTDDNRRALEILEKVGIAAKLFMVPFDPGVTPEELETNLRFYRERFATGRGYDVTPLSLGNYLCPYPGTGTRAVYEKNGWLNGSGPIAFRASDRRMQKVGEALIRFVGSIEPAFPMSYLGLGNLWVNSAGLPAPVYGRIGGMCDDIGNLLVEFAEWALAVTARSQPIPIGQIEGLIGDLRRFLARIAALREELRAITAAHGSGRQTVGEIESSFAGDLFLLGRRRKRLIHGKTDT